MTQDQIAIVQEAARLMPLISWNGDNRQFVVEIVCGLIPLRKHVRQVIRWAYGYDGFGISYEKKSDGSSVVGDLVLLGKLLKDPPGVGHDALFNLHHRGLSTPDGHIWTLKECNDWYQDAVSDFGYPGLSDVRRFGLFLGSWYPWHFGGRHG